LKTAYFLQLDFSRKKTKTKQFALKFIKNTETGEMAANLDKTCKRHGVSKA